MKASVDADGWLVIKCGPNDWIQLWRMLAHAYKALTQIEQRKSSSF